MASLNKAMLIGCLGKDPEIRHTASGTTVASFTVATSEKFKNKTTGEMEEKTDWHNITCWGKLAEICEKWLVKGSQVYIEGRIQTQKWQDKEGNDRYTTSIVSDTMKMLGGKQGGEKQQASAPAASGNEQAFNPDDDIPF